MWRRWLFAVFLLFGALGAVSPSTAAAWTPDELASLIVTPEDLGGGYVTIFEEPDARLPSFFRVLEQRTPSPAVIGVIALGDPVAAPREAVATIVRPFLQEYTLGGRYSPPGFPPGAVAVTLSGGTDGQQSSGVALAWQEANVLATMTVLLEWGPETTAATAAAEVARLTEAQRDKLAAALAPPAEIVERPRPSPPAQAPRGLPQRPRTP